MTFKELEDNDELGKVVVKALPVSYENIESFVDKLYEWILAKKEEWIREAKIELVNKIIQDVFDAGALTIRLEYIQEIKNELLDQLKKSKLKEK